MGLFSMQSHLMQTEGILGRLACMPFNAGGMTIEGKPLGDTYRRLGAYYLPMSAERNDTAWKQYRQLWNTEMHFCALLAHPSVEIFCMKWALDMLGELLYSKTVPNSPIPLMWSMDEKTRKDTLKALMPYISSVPMQDHAAFAAQIATRAMGNANAPADLIAALKQGATAKYTDAEKKTSRIILAVMRAMNVSLLYYNRPTYARGSDTLTGSETCFVTLSRDIIVEMARSGLFSCATDANVRNSENLAAIKKFDDAFIGGNDVLCGKKMLTLLSKGVIPAAKLTPKMIDNGQCYFDLTIMQSGITPSENLEILPVSLLTEYCEGFLESTKGLLKGIELECIRADRSETYNVVVTPSPQVYVSAYSECDDNDRKRQRSNMPVGFSLRRGAIVLLNLESSLYSSQGYCNLNPYLMGRAKMVDLEKINRSLHKINPTAVISVLINFAHDKGAAVMPILREIKGFTRLYKNDNYSEPEVMRALLQLHYSDVYPVLRKHCPDADKLIANSGNRSEFKLVALTGDTPEARMASLKQLLAENVVYLRYTSSKGEEEVYATSNEGILAKTFGSDYKLRYEPWEIRVATLKQLILRDSYNESTAMSLARSYDIKELASCTLKGMTEEAIDTWIAEARSKRTVRNTTDAPNLIRVRNVKAIKLRGTNEIHDYWRSIKIETISCVSVSTGVITGK